jgi:UDP-N-acetylmuramoyl-L-alanyl-D-glutamate--2,6-diaminopimelate ligase
MPATQSGNSEDMERIRTLMGFESFGLLSGSRRAGNWSDQLPGMTGISTDSRDTQPGHLFVALPGTERHGAKFVAEALRRGAVAVLTDSAGLAVAEADVGTLTIPVLVNDEPRSALASIAARWYGDQPDTLVAVTGTNGKTSVASFTRQLWEGCGETAVNIGTVGVQGAVSAPLKHTTPDPLSLHKLLSDLVDRGVTHAALEASSHGLDQRRIDGTHLSAAAFTNISRDHLDYHPDFGSYFEAKLGLFGRVLPRGETAVINFDDERAEQVRAMANSRGQRIVGVGSKVGCDLQIVSQNFTPSGQDLHFKWRGESLTVRLKLIGGFQAQNALIAVGLAIGSGSEPGTIFEALPGLASVRGRMELAATRANGGAVYVDYAHTPDALRTALKALRLHTRGSLNVVFGAGGNRDRGKRPIMGQVAASLADRVYVTDDNPRNEDARRIRAEVMAGCPRATEIADRAEAILVAIDNLGPEDVLLVAGKGHEAGQIVGDSIIPFDDVEQASVAVAALDGLTA